MSGPALPNVSLLPLEEGRGEGIRLLDSAHPELVEGCVTVLPPPAVPAKSATQKHGWALPNVSPLPWRERVRVRGKLRHPSSVWDPRPPNVSPLPWRERVRVRGKLSHPSSVREPQAAQTSPSGSTGGAAPQEENRGKGGKPQGESRASTTELVAPLLKVQTSPYPTTANKSGSAAPLARGLGDVPPVTTNLRGRAGGPLQRRYPHLPRKGRLCRRVGPSNVGIPTIHPPRPCNAAVHGNVRRKTANSRHFGSRASPGD